MWIPGSGGSPGGGLSDPLQCSCLENPRDPRPGPLFEGNPVGEGTSRRGNDTPAHHPEKPAGSTHSSTRGLRLPEELERQPEFHSSDKTRHDSPVPTLHVHRVGDAIQPSHPLSSPSPPAPNPSQHQVFSSESTLCMRWPKYWNFTKVPRHAGFPRGEHRGSRHRFL